MRLLLIRHGQTPSNVLGLLDTAPPGAALTALGREQASGVPAVLTDQPVDLIVVSNLIRTQLTAAPLAADRGLTPWNRDGVREVSAGDWEMSGAPDEVRGYLDMLGAWMDGNLRVRVPGGETGEQVLARFDRVVAEIADADVEAAVVFSHGAVIRVWADIRSSNLTSGFGRENPIGNTGVVVLDGDPATGWTVIEWSGAPIGVPVTDELVGAGPTAEGPDTDR